MIKGLTAILAVALMVAGRVFAGPEVSSPSNHVVNGGHGVEKSVDSNDRTKWCGLHEAVRSNGCLRFQKTEESW